MAQIWHFLQDARVGRSSKLRGPRLGSQEEVPGGILRLPTPDAGKGKGRGTAWAGPRAPEVPPGLGQPLGPHPRAGPGQSRAPRGLHFERPRTPTRRSGRLRTYRPRGRPPSGSGTARSSGPSGLREGGGAGNPSQRGTQRNRKGSPRRTKTTSRSYGPLRQSEGWEGGGLGERLSALWAGCKVRAPDSCEHLHP